MIQNANEARDLFQQSSMTLEDVLSVIEDNSREQCPQADIKGWLSDQVIAELESRGFKVAKTKGLWLHTEIYW